jgi:membrane-associated phospholipid phosphatase
VKRGRVMVAEIVSAIFNPALLLGAFLVVLATTLEPPQRRMRAAATAILFATLIPLGIVVVLRMARTVNDLDLRVREERPAVYLLCAASYACGVLGLILGNANWQIPGILGVVLCAAVIASVVNRRTKVSIHAMTSFGLCVAALDLFGSRAWPLLLALPVVAWARLAAGAHTPAEFAAGAALGAAVTPLGLGLLRMALGR